MRIVSHILILVLIVSLYTSYYQWQYSKFYLFSAAMELKKDWRNTVVFAAKAAKANPINDLPLHLLGKGLLEQGHLQAGISIMRKALTVRPHKKYLIHNLKVALHRLKTREKATK